MNWIRSVFRRFEAILERHIRLPIASKLILSFLSIIVLSSLIFTLLGAQIISSLVKSEAEDRVRNDLNTARMIYTDTLSNIQDKAEFTAVRTFLADILNGDVNQTYVDELRNFKVKEGLDILTITDDKGVVVLRINNPESSGDDQSQQALVSAVLKTKQPVARTVILPADELALESKALAYRAYFEFVDTPLARPRPETEQTAGMVLMSAVPVFDKDEKLIGVVYAGVLLNHDYTIVDEVKQTVFQGVVYKDKDIGTATIFQDDVRISTNVYGEDGERAVGTRVAEDVYEQVVVKGEQYLGRAYVVNNWYIAAYEPIRGYNGDILGILYVGILEQKYTDIKNQTMQAFLIITFVGVVVSVFIALYISRRISRSVSTLAKASKQLAGGNLETRVARTSNDELGDLADNFNFMANALRERDEKLREFTKRKIMESERLALIGQLSANVAHELNNPLQGIVTYSNLLLEGEACNEETRSSAEKIAIQANRCRDIIRGLLDFSRHKNPDKTLCSVNNLLRRCVSLVERQTIFHNIEIVMNLDESDPLVVVDPSQVERVFLNLIINAADAMENGGQLTLITGRDQDGKNVEIKVQDTGHGISEENMEKIFDPFFTTKETGHGVGLGLAISFGIVTEHNGAIDVESEPGKGTTFTVSFPLGRMKDDTNNG
ncbi:two-component system, NtrC family, sensor kinase [Anaerolineales bacterium]|nr:two-component system, NtrC family, sensor kinase [Anaerolineales bacterium]